MKKIMIMLCVMLTVGLNLSAQEFKGNFTKIDARSVYDIELVRDENCSVRIESPEELKEYVKVKIEYGTLRLDCENTNANTRIKAYITMPKLEELDMSGMTHLTSKGEFLANELEMSISGTSSVANFKVTCDDAELKVSGTSKLFDSIFNCNDADLKVSGSTTLSNLTFNCNDTDLDISGASKVEVTIKGTSLEADVSGASKVTVKGSVRNIELEASGASNFSGSELVAQEGKVDISGASDVTTSIKEKFKLKKSGASKFTNNPD